MPITEINSQNKNIDSLNTNSKDVVKSFELASATDATPIKEDKVTLQDKEKTFSNNAFSTSPLSAFEVVKKAPVIPEQYKYTELQTFPDGSKIPVSGYKGLGSTLAKMSPVATYGNIIFAMDPQDYSRSNSGAVQSQILSAINQLKSTHTGTKLLDDANKSTAPLLVKLVTGNNANGAELKNLDLTPPGQTDRKFTNSFYSMTWNMNAGYSCDNNNGKTANLSPVIVLGHELGHMQEAERIRRENTKNSDKKDMPIGFSSGYGSDAGVDNAGLSIEEKRNTTDVEKKLAQELGLTPREAYNVQCKIVNVNSPIDAPK